MSARAKLRLGTRGSELARTQSGTVAAELERLGMAVELTIIKTSGDQNTTSTFASIGPQGVFVREIEQALVEKRIELAVHSFKDLPTRSPDELVIGAVPKRVDPADLLLVRERALAGSALDWLPLPHGARVGTASARRRVWLAHFRPDLAIEPLRGNVPTRIRKLHERRLDAIVLAAAGVDRLRGGEALAGARAADRHVEDARLPRVVRHEVEQALDERGLAGAVRPDQAEGLAGAHLEVDAAQRVDAAVALLQSSDRDSRAPHAR